MELSKFLMMRSELSLLLVVLILLVFEIFSSKNKQGAIINIATGIFLLHTILGFMPSADGQLFGGMYQHTALSEMMKSILNVGVLILFMQSSGWLKKEENRGKVTEFFMLTLSTLLGMYFMISAGDFLMLYLGLELATIPLAVLHKGVKFRCYAGFVFADSRRLPGFHVHPRKKPAYPHGHLFGSTCAPL